MDDSRIPWWLALLVGTSVIGLAGWQSSRLQPQMRRAALGLALVYLALLAYAIGGDPRGVAANRVWRTSELLNIGLCVVSLISAVLLTGRPAFRGQLIWFGMMSLANTGIAVTCSSDLVTSLLALLVFVVGVMLVRELRRGESFHSAELWPVRRSDHDGESPFHPWLAAATGLVLAVLLVGASYYALRAESYRASPSRRHSAIPSRSRIRTVLSLPNDREQSNAGAEQRANYRADIVLMSAVLAFIAMASAMSKRVTSDE